MPHLDLRHREMQTVTVILLLGIVGLLNAGPLPSEPLLQTQENFDLNRVRIVTECLLNNILFIFILGHSLECKKTAQDEFALILL